MKNRSHAGRYSALSTVLICIGLAISGCAGDDDAAIALDSANATSAANPSTEAKAATPPPEPSLYTETICKIKDGATLPPAVASSAFACLRDKMRYKNSGHRLAGLFEGWSRLDSGPFFSKVHGNRYVAVFANDRALTTLSAAPDAPITSGVAMATPSFSLAEDGTLEPGPLFLLEKMQKGFNTVGGNWRYTVIGPEGDIIGVTKGQHSDDIDFCKDCDRKSADGVYLALLRGQAPGKITTRGEQQKFDPTQEGITPAQPILDPNAPLSAGEGALPAIPGITGPLVPGSAPLVPGASPPTPDAAPVPPVGGPILVPGAEQQPLNPTAPVLNPNDALTPSPTATLNPTAPILDPTKPVLDPGTAPVVAGSPALDPTKPLAVQSPSIAGPIITPTTGSTPGTSALTPPDPTQPALNPNAPALDPNAPALDPNKPALDPNAPALDPNAPALDPNAPATASSITPLSVDSNDPITEQSAPDTSQETATTPTTPADATALLNPDAPITAQPNPLTTQAPVITPAPATATPAPLVGGPGALNPDAPITAQTNPLATTAPSPTTPAPVIGGGALNPDAPITAQPNLLATPKPAPTTPAPVIGGGGSLNPDAPITAQQNPFANAKPAPAGPAPKIGGPALLNPDAPISAQTKSLTSLANQPLPSRRPAPAAARTTTSPVRSGAAGNLENPDLPIRQQEISGYFK